MPKATEPLSTTPTRRILLGRVAAAAPTAVLVTVSIPLAAAEAPDPHSAWTTEADRLRDWIDGPESEDVPDDDKDPAYDEMCRLHDLICRTPSRTMEGAAAQVRRAIDCHDYGCMPGEVEVEGLRNALATLDRLAGRA